MFRYMPLINLGLAVFCGWLTYDSLKNGNFGLATINIAALALSVAALLRAR